eukprot:COSAG02_NODE_3598_length_6507_cov_15.869538_2_plen_106_part_00
MQGGLYWIYVLCSRKYVNPQSARVQKRNPTPPPRERPEQRDDGGSIVGGGGDVAWAGEQPHWALLLASAHHLPELGLHRVPRSVTALHPSVAASLLGLDLVPRFM